MSCVAAGARWRNAPPAVAAIVFVLAAELRRPLQLGGGNEVAQCATCGRGDALVPSRSRFQGASNQRRDVANTGVSKEPVVADGGELIILAPHIREVSRVHGQVLERIGYHVRDVFVAQWERYRHEPWGVLGHSAHVKGDGSFADGVERPRIQVTLATGIPRATCERIALGWRDSDSIDVRDFEGRESAGVLYVPKAGETLFRLAP